MASYAAQQQGKFWQYHDLLFENHKTLNSNSFNTFAQQLGLNMPLFTKHMNSKEAKDRVTRDFQNGREVGVTGTPTVFINGRRLRSRTVDGVQKIIAEELK